MRDEKDERTVGISDLNHVLETDRHSQTKKQHHPVDLRDVDLSINVVGGVHHFHPRKASESHTLIDDGKCGRDDCLAAHNRGQRRYDEHRPKNRFCMTTTSVNLLIAN